MTDEYYDGDDPEILAVRFLADRQTFEKLTTAAAIQGLDLNQAINHAMQHYEITLSAEPGKVLRFNDADQQPRRLYVVPDDFSRWENAMTIGVLLMVMAAPLMALWPGFFVSWFLGLLITGISFVNTKVN